MKFAQKTTLFLGMVLTAQALVAQPEPAARAGQGGVVDLSVTYNAQHATTTGGNNFWMNGGSVEVSNTFYHGLGAAFNVTGAASSQISSPASSTAPVGLNLVTYTIGPHYTWFVPAMGRIGNLRLFGRGLFGLAAGRNSVFPAGDTVENKAYSIAAQAGGGVNLALNRSLSLRVIQVEWLRTQLSNGFTNVENSLRLGTGVTYRFPR